MLDERLALCAEFVRKDTKLADVGTDHAYLPVWLAKNKIITSAVASDVRQGPLDNALSNIEGNNVGGIVKAVLSDGLDKISPDEADDIVMAGMGAQLMIRIIDRTQWLRDPEKRLILQPMTRAEELRLYLCENGFSVISEKACVCHKKTYSVMCCEYDGVRRSCSDEFMYIGGLSEDKSSHALRYISVVNMRLKKKLRGLPPGSDEYKRISELTEKFDTYTGEG